MLIAAFSLFKNRCSLIFQAKGALRDGTHCHLCSSDTVFIARVFSLSREWAWFTRIQVLRVIHSNSDSDSADCFEFRFGFGFGSDEPVRIRNRVRLIHSNPASDSDPISPFGFGIWSDLSIRIQLWMLIRLIHLGSASDFNPVHPFGSGFGWSHGFCTCGFDPAFIARFGSRWRWSRISPFALFELTIFRLITAFRLRRCDGWEIIRALPSVVTRS